MVESAIEADVDNVWLLQGGRHAARKKSLTATKSQKK
jgi:hypothetical protein